MGQQSQMISSCLIISVDIFCRSVSHWNPDNFDICSEGTDGQIPCGIDNQVYAIFFQVGFGDSDTGSQVQVLRDLMHFGKDFEVTHFAHN